MPRPRKCRKVCCLPTSTKFAPEGNSNDENDIIVMSVEEYETIRLIDYEGLMQEECAESMNVARTTVQRIYNDARIKLADFLVSGKRLTIEGGDFRLCEDSQDAFGCGKCHGQRRQAHAEHHS
jgi:uncharacterized protein